MTKEKFVEILTEHDYHPVFIERVWERLKAHAEHPQFEASIRYSAVVMKPIELTWRKAYAERTV